MYKCICVICGAKFTLDQPYDVCSMKCEAKRWDLDVSNTEDEKINFIDKEK